jgi:hypothetical protein
MKPLELVTHRRTSYERKVNARAPRHLGALACFAELMVQAADEGVDDRGRVLAALEHGLHGGDERMVDGGAARGARGAGSARRRARRVPS